MAEFSKLVITVNGQALISKVLTGVKGIEFTKICASSSTYTVNQLEGLTALSDIKQTSAVSKITRTNDVAIQIETAFMNTDLTAGYYMRTIGLYANDLEGGEILYAVTIETSGNCYMPPYNGITVSGAYVKLVTTIGNADNVTLNVDPAAVATVGDVLELRNRITLLESRSDEKPKELTLSWTEIKARCEAGDFSGINVGDYKTANLTHDRTMVFEVAGIDIYTNETTFYAGTLAYPEHHIDFISRDCIQGEHIMHEKLDTFWDYSIMRGFLNDRPNGVFYWLEADLQKVISYKKYEYNRSMELGTYSNTQTGYLEDRIWLPTEIEVFGFRTYSGAGWGAYGGIQYPIFKRRKSLFKGEGEGLLGANGWWLCSASAYNKTHYCCVTDNGTPGSEEATALSGMAIGFRIQKSWPAK